MLPPVADTLSRPPAATSINSVPAPADNSWTMPPSPVPFDHGGGRQRSLLLKLATFGYRPGILVWHIRPVPYLRQVFATFRTMGHHGAVVLAVAMDDAIDT